MTSQITFFIWIQTQLQNNLWSGYMKLGPGQESHWLLSMLHDVLAKEQVHYSYSRLAYTIQNRYYLTFMYNI